MTVDVEVTGPVGARAVTAAPTTAGSTTSTSDGDSGVIVTSTLPAPDQAGDGAQTPTGDSAPLLRLVVAASAGSTVTLAPDDTGAVVASTGDLVVGFATPLAVDSAGTALATSWQVPDTASGTAPDRTATDPSALDAGLAVDLVLDTATRDVLAQGTGPLTVTVHLGTTTVSATEWGTREGGESLAVTPSAWGRVSGQTGYTLGWADVVRREPTAQTSVMEKQFRCHQLGAPDKATWNLEPWRPDVSYLAYVAARCNPV